jgi:hypothetical protein
LDTLKLWTWLLKSDTKIEIYCPEDLKVTIEDFTKALQERIEKDSVPAKASLCQINWEDAKSKQVVILLKPTDSDIDKNVFNFLITLDTVGNYTYIDEKIYIKPHKIPSFPDKKKHEPDVTWKSLALGIFFIILGITWNICFFPGIYLIFWHFARKKHLGEAKETNKKASDTPEKIAKSWEEWEKNTLDTAYYSANNSKFGKLNQAMSSTVIQVIKALFESKKAVLKYRVEKETSIKQIKDEAKKRMEESKKKAEETKKK